MAKLFESHGEVRLGNQIIGHIQKCPNPVQGPASKEWFFESTVTYQTGTAPGKRAAMEALARHAAPPKMLERAAVQEQYRRLEELTPEALNLWKSAQGAKQETDCRANYYQIDGARLALHYVLYPEHYSGQTMADGYVEFMQKLRADQAFNNFSSPKPQTAHGQEESR